MKQKVASGSNKGQGQSPAWQHGFVAAAGIPTPLISVHGCRRQGSPCVCVRVSSHGWTLHLLHVHAARAGPRRTIRSWELFMALQKENRYLNAQSENWTSHLTTVSGVAVKVTDWERCRVFITGVIYQLFSMVLLLSALGAESGTWLSGMGGMPLTSLSPTHSPSMWSHFPVARPVLAWLVWLPGSCWSELMNEVLILN